VTSNNLFATVLGAVAAPDGWSVQPCEGDGPYLCALDGDTTIGGVELSVYPIETMTDFVQMLRDAGIDPQMFDPGDPAQTSGLLTALRAFVASYHTTFETDRQVEYGDRIRYERLPTEEIEFGALPGLRYGFAGLNADNSTYERWISYVTFDGDLMYIMVVPYRPDAVPTFRSDAELQEFLPYLQSIAANLKLPLPVATTDVRSVRALRDLEIRRDYAMQSNPVGQIATGQIVQVRGVSPNRRFWRIDCPDQTMRNCWIAADPQATEPLP
jgi:hypothetical protein